MPLDPSSFDSMCALGFDVLFDNLEEVPIGDEAPWFAKHLVVRAIDDFVEVVNEAFAVRCDVYRSGS